MKKRERERERERDERKKERKREGRKERKRERTRKLPAGKLQLARTMKVSIGETPEKCNSSEDRGGFLNFVFRGGYAAHGCHYVSANSHVVVNHLWLLCALSRAKPRKQQQLHEFPGSFSDPCARARDRGWLVAAPIAAGYVCNLQTKGEESPRREAERADEQVPARLQSFYGSSCPRPPLFSSPSLPSTLSSFRPSCSSSSVLLFSVARFNKLIRVGAHFFFSSLFRISLPNRPFLILIPLELEEESGRGEGGKRKEKKRKGTVIR